MAVRDYQRFIAALVTTAALVLCANVARADDAAYRLARRQYQPLVVADLSFVAGQPTRFYTQAVEFHGRLTGVLRSSILTTILLRLDNGQTAQLLARPEQETLPVGQHVTVLARLAEPPGEVLSFMLLAMAEATAQPAGTAESAAADQRGAQPLAGPQTPLQPRFALPSRRGTAQISEERILAAYERAIGYFNSRLDRSQRVEIAQRIIEFSRAIGVDARLVMAVIAVESNFNASATSRKGAMGLGQLMPATARGMGVANPYDTSENLWAAVRIVRGNLERNGGDIALALACYNAGSGAVRKYGGIPPYRETQNYIRKVLDIYLKLAPEMAR